MVDKIDGVPGSIGKYDTAENLQDFDTAEPLQSRMLEGEAFTKKDNKAIEYVKTFVQATGNRLRSDTITARAAKHDYLDADYDAAQQLEKIVFTSHVSANKNPYV